MDLKEIELGQTLNFRELRNQCKAVWGGVAWPGKRPGFAVVVGMDQKRHLDSHDVYLLDEFESFDMRDLVRQCGALDLKYCISLYHYYSSDWLDRWIGDYKNDAASRFIQEMNNEYTRTPGQTEFQRHFSLNSTHMLEMEKLYQYILPQIKELLNPEHRQLFLKNSKILNYLSTIEESEITTFELGDYPAIEALAFAVIEMRKYVEIQERTSRLPNSNPWPTGNPVNRRKNSRNILLRGFADNTQKERRFR